MLTALQEHFTKISS